MKVYVELLIPLVILLIFFIWKIWFTWSRRRLLKKYDRRNDKGRSGRKFSSEESGTGESIEDSNRYEQPEGRELLPKASADDVGENIPINRKVGFFRRRKTS